MSIQAHVNALEEKHNILKQRIQEEAMRPAPDFTLITLLKKQKLSIKEEIFKTLAESSMLDEAAPSSA